MLRGLLLVFAGVVVLFWAFYTPQPRKAEAKRIEPFSSVVVPAPSVNRFGRISTGSYNDQVPVCADKATLSEVQIAAARGDAWVLVQAAASGRTFHADRDARVRVLEESPFHGAVKVRILEKQSAGAAGWIPREWLRPEAP